MVKWLENRKIRFYPPEDRAHLDNIQDDSWPTAFASYVSDLGGVSNARVDTVEERTRILDWLLSYAIGIEYSDRVEELQQIQPQPAELNNSETSVASKEPNIELDLESPEFRRNLNELTECLGIPKDDSVEAMLRACAAVLEQKFTARALDLAEKEKVLILQKFTIELLVDFHNRQWRVRAPSVEVRGEENTRSVPRPSGAPSSFPRDSRQATQPFVSRLYSRRLRVTSAIRSTPTASHRAKGMTRREQLPLVRQCSSRPPRCSSLWGG